MFFIGRTPCVSSLIADKYLLCLHNYSIMSFPALEKKNHSVLSEFFSRLECPSPVAPNWPSDLSFDKWVG